MSDVGLPTGSGSEEYGLAAVCLVMLAKAAGVPVPIPGDLILLATAARAAEGRLVLWQAFIALLVAVLVGGAIQFAAARGPGRRLVYRVARLAGLGADRLNAVAAHLQRRGPLSLSVALFMPGVRNAAVPACGIAGLSYGVFLPALALASALDLSVHFALGAAGGSLIASSGANFLVLLLALVVLAAVGFVGWRLIARGRAPVAAWEATACPACLALGAVSTAFVGAPLPEETERVHL